MATKTNIVTWDVDGTNYAVDLYDIDGIEWRDALRATEYDTQGDLIVAALTLKNFTAIAALLWIWRRRENKELTFDEVLGGLSYGSMMDPDEDETETEPPPPG